MCKFWQKTYRASCIYDNGDISGTRCFLLSKDVVRPREKYNPLRDVNEKVKKNIRIGLSVSSKRIKILLTDSLYGLLGFDSKEYHGYINVSSDVRNGCVGSVKMIYGAKYSYENENMIISIYIA